MKILLISPFDNKIWSLGELKFPPLGLAVLASLTPDEINVEIIDESVRSITDYTDDIDLVAISVMTPLAPRAYELADFYRKLGVKVILGGWHPTLIPEEALKHADSVMIGALFAGCKETPGTIHKEGNFPNYHLYKRYRGSASLESKQLRNDEKRNVEGISSTIDYKGPAKYVIRNIEDGLRSAFSYAGATSIREFHQKVTYIWKHHKDIRTV